MIKIIFSVIILIIFSNSLFSQTESQDSIYSGRVCILILKNGFESDGIITGAKKDTIEFRNEYTEYKIAVNDIKIMLNPGEELSVENKTKDEVKKLPVDGLRLLTKECDLYLKAGTLLKDVKLVSATDSSVFAIKDVYSRNVNNSDIRKIVFKPAAPFGYGFLIGSAIGFVAGFLPLAFAEGGGHPDISGPGAGLIFGLILAIPTGLVGGLIGLVVASDDVYYFDKGYSITKNKRLKYVMHKHRM